MLNNQSLTGVRIIAIRTAFHFPPRPQTPTTETCRSASSDWRRNSRFNLIERTLLGSTFFIVPRCQQDIANQPERQNPDLATHVSLAPISLTYFVPGISVFLQPRMSSESLFVRHLVGTFHCTSFPHRCGIAPRKKNDPRDLESDDGGFPPLGGRWHTTTIFPQPEAFQNRRFPDSVLWSKRIILAGVVAPNNLGFCRPQIDSAGARVAH
ncbi:hypothetical protein B0H16DRAFT_1550267 [Mycena metata]|uniref:Uncharacterized protein n=1 Tax=Mycena metata TaxID=1033252 RepID=A0AAD7N8L6_9AGAR|nr:hypothetical protein B0H16DRAFT_1550267 [Mycena metata]